MAPRREQKLTHRRELERLEPSLQTRIHRTFWIAGVWGGLLLLGAISLTLAKPYLTKRRLERMRQPDYKPSAIPKRPVAIDELRKYVEKDREGKEK